MALIYFYIKVHTLITLLVRIFVRCPVEKLVSLNTCRESMHGGGMVDCRFALLFPKSDKIPQSIVQVLETIEHNT